MAKKKNESTKHFEEQFGRRVPKKPFMPKGSENWQENAGFKKASAKGEGSYGEKRNDKKGEDNRKGPSNRSFDKPNAKPFERKFNNKYASDTNKGGVKENKSFKTNGSTLDRPNRNFKNAPTKGDRPTEGTQNYKTKGKQNSERPPYKENFRKPLEGHRTEKTDSGFSRKKSNEAAKPKERKFDKSNSYNRNKSTEGTDNRPSAKKTFAQPKEKKEFNKSSFSKEKKNETNFAVRKVSKEGDLEIIDTYQDEYITSSANKRANRQNESLVGEQMPLNKYVSRCGVCGRREAAELIKSGRVKVNSVVETNPAYRVLETDKVSHNDKAITMQYNLVYVLLNKPKDFITTSDDPEGRKTVMDLVENAVEERIYPVGRLDRNTSGLLLLTNDGALAQKMSHPKYAIRKLYQVNLDKVLTKPDFEKIMNGLTLEDGNVTVDELAYIDPSDKSKIGIEIHSGRNRIVRRIFESLGYVVKHLDRVMYANLTKKNLPRGKWRFLSESEVRNLKHY